MAYATNRQLFLWAALSLMAASGIQCTPRQGGGDNRLAAAATAKASEANSPATMPEKDPPGKTAQSDSSPVGAKLEAMAKSDHVALLQLCLRHYHETYRDYTCVFEKQERLSGDLSPVQEIGVKFMDNPYSVAMHWGKKQLQADRLLYVEGKWKNQLIVLPSGLAALAGSRFIAPDGPDAMKDTLKPVSAFGFERTLRALIDGCVLARKNGELRQESGGYAKVDGRSTLVLVQYLPQKPQYLGSKILTYIDVEYLAPVMLEAYGWDDKHVLTCRYAYRNVKFNVGLADKDFLPKTNGMTEPR